MGAFSLLTGKLPFDGTEDEIEAAIMQGQVQMTGTAWLGISDSAKAFIKELLSVNPADRPTAEEALSRPWVATGSTAASIQLLVKFVQSAGFPTVRMFSSPLEPRCVIGEIPSGSQGFLYGDVSKPTNACHNVQYGNLNGWVGAKNIQRQSGDDAGILKSVQAFATANAMKRAAAAVAVCSQTVLEGDDIAVAEKCFKSLASGNGAISQHEFTQLLQRELNIDPQQSLMIFKQLDMNNDKEIQRSEFLAAVVGGRLLKSPSEIGKVFERFDVSKDGKLHPWELTDALGERFCGQPTRQIFSEVDKNGDNVIDFNEFSSLVSTCASDLTPRSSVSI